MKTFLLSSAATLCMLVTPVAANAMTSHEGWPKVDGMLLMNKQDQNRPLDGRPGKDPFGGKDPSYSCDGLHKNSSCVRGRGRESFVPKGRCVQRPREEEIAEPANEEQAYDEQVYEEPMARTSRSGRGQCTDATNKVPANIGHNELLGGHGNDVIHAGPRGDIIWGDYKEDSPQPTSQRDRLFGGKGRDFIFASHGRNTIKAGAGNDWVKAHWGRGSIDCGPGKDLLYLSGPARGHYTVRNCETVSKKTLGY